MGAKLSCLALFRSRSNDAAHDEGDATHRCKLTWQDLLVELPVNHLVGRTQREIPGQCLLTVPLFLQLHERFPPHIQHRKLELVYSSWEHGFSSTALKTCLTDRRTTRDASVNQELLLLIRPSLSLSTPVSKFDEVVPVTGAFLPTGIDFSNRKYYGSDTTFVFTNIAEGSQKTAEFTSPLTKSDGGNQQSPSSSFSASGVFTMFGCSTPKVNEYFLRTTDGIIIGGGGKGAAIAITDDLDFVLSSISCPTFGSTCLLPVERHESDGGTPSGVVVEGFQSRAPIHTLEVWGVSNTLLDLSQ